LLNNANIRYRTAAPVIAPAPAGGQSDPSLPGGLPNGPDAAKRVRYHVRSWPGKDEANLLWATADGSIDKPFLSISHAIFSPRRIRCNEILPGNATNPTVIEIVVAHGAVLRNPIVDPYCSHPPDVALAGSAGGWSSPDATMEHCWLVITGAGWEDTALPITAASGSCLSEDNGEGSPSALQACSRLNHPFNVANAGCPLAVAWPAGGPSKLPQVWWNDSLKLFDTSRIIIRAMEVDSPGLNFVEPSHNVRDLRMVGLRFVSRTSAADTKVVQMPTPKFDPATFDPKKPPPLEFSAVMPLSAWASKLHTTIAGHLGSDASHPVGYNLSGKQVSANEIVIPDLLTYPFPSSVTPTPLTA